jgi:hypothetical protein
LYKRFIINELLFYAYQYSTYVPQIGAFGFIELEPKKFKSTTTTAATTTWITATSGCRLVCQKGKERRGYRWNDIGCVSVSYKNGLHERSFCFYIPKKLAGFGTVFHFGRLLKVHRACLSPSSV